MRKEKEEAEPSVLLCCTLGCASEIEDPKKIAGKLENFRQNLVVLDGVGCVSSYNAVKIVCRSRKSRKSCLVGRHKFWRGVMTSQIERLLSGGRVPPDFQKT